MKNNDNINKNLLFAVSNQNIFGGNKIYAEVEIQDVIKENTIKKTPIMFLEQADLTRNKECLNMSKRYQQLNTIRRNLRTAYTLINHGIHIKNNINLFNREEIADITPLTRSGILHAIVLYSRWFLNTTGKICLKPNDFYQAQSIERSYHDYIVTLRNEYVAHNEKDIFCHDTVVLETTVGHDNWELKCIFTENIFAENDNFKLEDFKSCIEVVHNKVDIQIIECENKLKNKIKEIWERKA